jgi:hypothetical protein
VHAHFTGIFRNRGQHWAPNLFVAIALRMHQIQNNFSCKFMCRSVQRG